MSVTVENIQNALKSVIDPNTGKDLISSKFAKNIKVEDGDVTLDVTLTYPAKSQIDLIRKLVINALRELPGVKNVSANVTMNIVAQVIQPGPMSLSDANHQLELIQFNGHTAADLVLWDKTTGVVFVGGLVFADRVPTTPHANIAEWLKSLETVSKWNTSKQIKALVPSHGPYTKGLEGIEQTKEYLTWLDQSFKNAALQGMDISEVLRLSIPYKFKGFAALKPEYLRNVTHLYPAYEKQIFKK